MPENNGQERYYCIGMFDPPIEGRYFVHTEMRGADSVHADFPESAARKWFFRMPADYRARCYLVIVQAWRGRHYVPYPIYDREPVVFWTKGWREERATAEPPDQTKKAPGR